MSNALSAIYDTWADADAARARLLGLGLPDASVRVVPELPERQAEGGDVGTTGGFVGALVSLFFPRDDRDLYEEALRRGGVLVAVEDVPPALRDQATAALDGEGAYEPDDRAEGWRGEGWATSVGEEVSSGRMGRREPVAAGSRVRSYVME